MMWMMGSRGGWKALSGCEFRCLVGLEGRSWSPMPTLVRGLVGDGEEQVGNLGVCRGLPGTTLWPVRDSVEDSRRICRGLSWPSWPALLRPSLGLGGASSRAFL